MHQFFCVILALIFCFDLAGQSQTQFIDELSQLKGKFDELSTDDMVFYLDSLESKISSNQYPDSLLSSFYYYRGLIDIEQNVWDTALVNLKKSVACEQSKENIDTLFMVDLYSNLFQPFEMLGVKDSSFYYIDTAIKLAESYSDKNVPELGMYYNKAGVSLLYNSDVENSLYYFRKGENHVKKYYPERHQEILQIGSGVAYNLTLLEKNEEAVAKYEELMQFAEDNGIPGVQLLAAYIGYAIACRTTKRFDEALRQIGRAEELTLQYLGDKHRAMGDIYNVKANIYKDQKDFENARLSFLKALENRISVVGENHYFTTEILWSLGDVNISLGNHEKGIQYLERGLKSTGYSMQDESYFLQRRNYNAVSNVLSFLIEGHLRNYEALDRASDLEQAMSLSEEAIFAIEQMRSNYTASGSKEYIVNEAYSIYENAIHACYLKYEKSGDEKYLVDAFSYMEKSKMQSMNEKARALSYNESDKIPTELQNKKEKNEEEINRLSDAITAEKSVETRLELEEEYFALKELQFSLLERLQNDYASHLAFIDNQEVTRVEDLLGHITESKAAVLSYFLGDKYLFRIAFDSTHQSFYKKELPEDFREQVGNFSNFQEEQNLSEKQSLVDGFAPLLLSDLPDFGSKGIEKMIVSPHAFLWFIPFDALNFNGEFLIKNYQLSYVNSLTLYDFQKDLSYSSNHSLLGIAPSYRLEKENQDDQIMLALPGAKAEVEAILEKWSGKKLIGEEASKKNFIKEAKNFEILHLAMHATYDQTKNPGLLFTLEEGTKLDEMSFQDLIGMELNANLVTLSACNTGFGKIKRGEGIQSLAYAFSFAGVPSTVISLWNVPDEATAYIMTAFYEELNKEIPKDEALRNAKLRYMADDGIPNSQKSLYHWGGFIINGNTSPILARSSSNWKLPGLLIFCLLLGFIIYRSINKK